MAHESMRDGINGHCEANINGGTIMFSNTSGEWKAATANMFVYVDDADAIYAKALAAGAKSIRK